MGSLLSFFMQDRPAFNLNFMKYVRDKDFEGHLLFNFGTFSRAVQAAPL